MELILLGTSGGGLLVPNRHLIAEVVVVGGEPLLFDCGEGAVRQLLRAHIPPNSVEHLFFTHHHLDHNTGYVSFVQISWLQGRERPLKVCGPPEIARMTDLLFGKEGVFRQDQLARTQDPGSQGPQLDRTGNRLSFIEIDVTESEESGVLAETDNWRVTAALTDHEQPWMETFAYRVDSDEGSIAIAVDSAPTQAVIDLARDADVLLHECSATKEFIHRWDMETGHTWPEAVARVATEANVRKLVCTHFFVETDNPKTMAEMEDTIRSGYDGELHMGEDLMRIPV